jgi:hypothetical protein
VLPTQLHCSTGLVPVKPQSSSEGLRLACPPKVKERPGDSVSYPNAIGCVRLESKHELMRLATRGVHVTRSRRHPSHTAEAYPTPQTAHGLQLVSVGSLIGRFKPQNSPPRPREVAHRKARERSAQGSSLAWAGRGGIRETLVSTKDTGIYFLLSVGV